MEIHLQMLQSQIDYTTGFYSGTSRDSFSRIHGLMIQAEQEAYDHFMGLSYLLPAQAEALLRLADMERRHRKNLEACGRHLHLTPNLEFAESFFADLRQAFQEAATNNRIATCLLIHVLGIECLLLAVHENYIPVADHFSRKVTESIVDDKYSHFNFCEGWLKAHFREVKNELKLANRQVLPIICRLLDRIQLDGPVIGISEQSLVEDFTIEYDRALSNIGFDSCEILRMLSHALIVNQVDSSYNDYRLFFKTSVET